VPITSPGNYFHITTSPKMLPLRIHPVNIISSA
jgi:hypothetical protein